LYYKKEKILKDFPLLSETLIELYQKENMIYYSRKTDKYDIDNIFQSRTMQFSLNHLIKNISIENKTKILKYLENKTKNQSKLRNKLTLLLSIKERNPLDTRIVNLNLTDSGVDRFHRSYGRTLGLDNIECDSVFSLVKGTIQSAKTWNEKSIKDLEHKYIEISKYIEQQEEIKLNNIENNEFKKRITNWKLSQKKYSLIKVEKKLYKRQSKVFGGIHYGKNLQIKINNLRKEINLLKQKEKLSKKDTRLLLTYENQIKRLKEERINSRLEYFISGDKTNGNHKIRIIQNNDNSYDLYFNIFGKKSENILIKDIKIPNNHKKYFNLSMNKKHSMRISKNKNNKYVVNCTYSYLKPLIYKNNKEYLGTLGIDIGPKEITCVHVKNDGNPSKKFSFSTGNLLDKRTEDTSRELSIILDKIVSYSETNNLFITIENLQISTKYKYRNPKLNRMLKKFNFKQFEELIVSKSTRKGIKLKQVNPAYTSQIGLLKYSNREDITSNHNSNSKDYSAAYVIGRRGLGFNDICVFSIRLFDFLLYIPGKSILKHFDENSFSETNLRKNKSNWSLWGKLFNLVNTNQIELGKLPKYWFKTLTTKEICYFFN